MARTEVKLTAANFEAILKRLSEPPKHVIVGVIGSNASKPYEYPPDPETGEPPVLNRAPPSLSQIATWNHFGAGHTPARPFFTVTNDKHRDALAERLVMFARGIAHGKVGWEQAMSLLGQEYTDMVKDMIAGDPPPGVPPKNATDTERKKGSTQPLVHTGQLRGAITYQVKDGT